MVLFGDNENKPRITPAYEYGNLLKKYQLYIIIFENVIGSFYIILNNL